ncbi:MAG: hypothetical protein JNK21_05615, partial [Rhodospirillaceae bacterium]|nr:hypothetical protein [Rhodospirillaceae bacterium]
GRHQAQDAPFLVGQGGGDGVVAVQPDFVALAAPVRRFAAAFGGLLGLPVAAVGLLPIPGAVFGAVCAVSFGAVCAVGRALGTALIPAMLAAGAFVPVAVAAVAAF